MLKTLPCLLLHTCAGWQDTQGTPLPWGSPRLWEGFAEGVILAERRQKDSCLPSASDTFHNPQQHDLYPGGRAASPRGFLGDGPSHFCREQTGRGRAIRGLTHHETIRGLAHHETIPLDLMVAPSSRAFNKFPEARGAFDVRAGRKGDLGTPGSQSGDGGLRWCQLLLGGPSGQ